VCQGTAAAVDRQGKEKCVRTIYNVRVETRREGERLVDYPKLHVAEALETRKLFKLDGRNSGFGWAINLPREERYLSPNAAWGYWLDNMTSKIHGLEQQLNDALALRDLGTDQAEIDCRAE
jgi:hypothetical protein